MTPVSEIKYGSYRRLKLGQVWRSISAAVLVGLAASCRHAEMHKESDRDAEQAGLERQNIVALGELLLAERSELNQSKLFVALAAACEVFCQPTRAVRALESHCANALERLETGAVSNNFALLDLLGFALIVANFEGSDSASDFFCRALERVPEIQSLDARDRMLYMASLYEPARLRGEFRWTENSAAVSAAYERLRKISSERPTAEEYAEPAQHLTLESVWRYAILDGRALDRIQERFVIGVAIKLLDSETPEWGDMVAIAQIMRARVTSWESRFFWNQRIRELFRTAALPSLENASAEKAAFVYASYHLSRMYERPEGWVFGATPP